MEPVIAWIDVETTGVEESVDNLLEVACLITDKNLNIVDPQGYHANVHHRSGEVVDLIERTDPYVVEMHNTTGLWGKLPYGKPLEAIDTELAAYLRNFAPEVRTVYMGGNSITLDRNFLRAYLPETFAHLSYRSVDVTSVALLVRWLAGDGVVYQKQYTHSALADIKESIQELRFLREVAFRPADEIRQRAKDWKVS